jgi:hypothetical protein
VDNSNSYPQAAQSLIYAMFIYCDFLNIFDFIHSSSTGAAKIRLFFEK